MAGTVGAAEGGSVGERSLSKGRCGAGVTGTVGDGALVDTEVHVPVGIVYMYVCTRTSKFFRSSDAKESTKTR